VWTAKGGERTFSLVEEDVVHDPCWRIEGGRVVAANVSDIAVYGAVTGRKLLALNVGVPPVPKPEFAHKYFEVSVSPTGSHLALWWRRANVWPPPSPDEQRAPAWASYLSEGPVPSSTCVDGCDDEYFAELWTLGAKPQRLWRHRYAGEPTAMPTWPKSKIASAPIAFSHDGRHVLLGFDDGEIIIQSVRRKQAVRVERLHRAPIKRIVVSPDDRYVFSEDFEGEQRFWPLAAATVPPPQKRPADAQVP
jgi:hypothetical protein